MPIIPTLMSMPGTPQRKKGPKRRYRYKFEEDIIQLPKMFFIPFAIVASPGLFFGLTTFVLFLEIVILKYMLSKDMARIKIGIYIFGIVAWFGHHLCYILMWLGV